MSKILVNHFSTGRKRKKGMARNAEAIIRLFVATRFVIGLHYIGIYKRICLKLFAKALAVTSSGRKDTRSA